MANTQRRNWNLQLKKLTAWLREDRLQSIPNVAMEKRISPEEEEEEVSFNQSGIYKLIVDPQSTPQVHEDQIRDRTWTARSWEPFKKQNGFETRRLQSKNNGEARQIRRCSNKGVSYVIVLLPETSFDQLPAIFGDEFENSMDEDDETDYDHGQLTLEKYCEVVTDFDLNHDQLFLDLTKLKQLNSGLVQNNGEFLDERKMHALHMNMIKSLYERYKDICHKVENLEKAVNIHEGEELMEE